MAAQFTTEAAGIDKLDRANKFKEQMKTVKEGFNMVLWVFSVNEM